MTTSRASKSKNAFFRIKASSDWFAEAVLYFRKLGFYEEFADLPDGKLVEKIKALREYESGTKLTHKTQLLLLLAQDKKRVWFRDAELCWDQQYVKFVEEWGKISCGTFNPEEITETRDKEKVKITFIHNGQKFEIYAGNFGEWLDLGVLGWINEIIRDTKYQFWDIVTGTQEACIVCVTAEQKKQLKKDLGLKFEKNDRYKYNPFPDELRFQ